MSTSPADFIKWLELGFLEELVIGIYQKDLDYRYSKSKNKEQFLREIEREILFASSNILCQSVSSYNWTKMLKATALSKWLLKQKPIIEHIMSIK